MKFAKFLRTPCFTEYLLRFLFEFFFIYIIFFFFNKHTVFHYIKLQLQQNNINKKTLHKAEI